MNRREKMFAVLPTLLTLGNAACGFGALTLSAKSVTTMDPTNALFVASSLIYLAMVFDALDGSAARLTKQTSEFGAQLDSLCDAISFGAAPAFLMLQFSRDYHPRLLWLIAVLYVVCAVLRLARFNVETDDDDSHAFFSGLPSPAAAGTVASFPIMVYGLRNLEEGGRDHPLQQVADWLDPLTVKILPLFTLAVACLMVSRIRYAHLFNTLVRGRRNRQHLIQLVFALAVIFILPQLSVPLLFCWFAFTAPLKALWNESVVRWWHRGRAQPVTAGVSGVSPSTVEWTSNTPLATTPPPDDEMNDA
jgi:CDP-diacylglycerol--serine O-phosphatidyltransferase